MRNLCVSTLLIVVLTSCVCVRTRATSPTFHLTHQIGRGTPDNIEWQPGGDMLLVSTITGAWLYTDSLDDIAHIVEARLASFSPNGHLLAGISNDDHITLWDTSTTFDQVSVLGPHTARVIELVWSPEGDRIASLDQMGHIAIWQIDSVAPRLRMKLADATEIAWSREGTYLAAIADVGHVQVWDTRLGQTVFSLPAYCRSTCYTQFLWRDDRQLLRWLLDENYTGELWDVSTRQMILVTTASGLSGPPTYSPDGSLLAWGTEIQDSLTGESVMPAPGYQSAWTKDGSTIASSYYSYELNGTVNITISSVPGGEMQQVVHESTDSVRHLTWHDDGDRLAGASDGIKVWRVSTGETLGVTYAHSGLEWPMSFSADGSLMAVTNERKVQVWNTQTGELAADLTGHPQYIRFVLWQPNGTLIATSTQGRGTIDSLDNTVRIWDSQRFSGMTEPTYTYSHDWRVQGLAWNPDGTRLASVDTGGIVRVWDAITHSVVLEFNVRDNAPVNFDAFPLGIEWSFEGNWIRVWYFSSGNPGGVALWNAHTGEFARLVGINTGVVHGWTSSDELLSAQVQSWGDIGYPPPIYEIPISISDPHRAFAAERLLLLEMLPAIVRDAEFQPAGEAFAVIDDDNTLWVWDIPSGHRRFKQAGITGLVWEPQGTQLMVWPEKSPAQIISAGDGTMLDELGACYERSAVWSLGGNQIACAVQGVLYLWER
jgi:WD40 repeat protein